MKVSERFKREDGRFWSLVRFLSAHLGYKNEKQNRARFYTEREVINILISENIAASYETVKELTEYLNYRSGFINDIIRPNLMDVVEAEKLYNQMSELKKFYRLTCKQPFNKQKGEKRKPAFLTCMVNILAEKVIREIQQIHRSDIAVFDDDPRGPSYFINTEGQIEYASSRRFDGAYPATTNPLMVWEIKEYYYTTTFGSRIADGIYESQLDGYELREFKRRTGQEIYHVLIVDSYCVWFKMGIPYLSRIVDMMCMDLIDEVIFGREVLTRWPELVAEMVIRNAPKG